MVTDYRLENFFTACIHRKSEQARKNFVEKKKGCLKSNQLPSS